MKQVREGFIKKQIITGIAVFIIFMIGYDSYEVAAPLAGLLLLYYLFFPANKRLFMVGPLRLWTFWVALLYLIFLGLQIFPITGIFLMFGMAIAGPYMWGMIPHLIILALILDILTKHISRVFVILPIFLYGGFYFLYFSQLINIAEVEKQLKAENSAISFAYDSKEYDLVSSNAEFLVSHYKIPVVFSDNKNFSENYLSYRLVTQKKCQELQKSGIVGSPNQTKGYACHGIRSPSSYEPGKIKIGRQLNSVAVFQMPDAPSKKKMVIVERDLEKEQRAPSLSGNGSIRFFYLWHVPKPHIQVSEVRVEDKVVGQFKSGNVAALSAFPSLIFGCALNDSPASWNCFSTLYATKKKLDFFPKELSRDVYGGSAIAALLKTPQYKESELMEFHDFPEIGAKIDQMVAAKNKETPADFNEWGIRKDSPKLPKIMAVKGISTYRGVIYSDKEGGPFVQFIKDNVGKTVHIQADLDRSTSFQTFQKNPAPYYHNSNFQIYGVMCGGADCLKGARVYELINNGAAQYTSKEDANIIGRIDGYWHVGRSERHGEDVWIFLEDVTTSISK